MKVTAKEIMRSLLDGLWGQYLRRVSYAKTYVDLVQSKNGKVVNDHIAFRTFTLWRDCLVLVGSELTG